MTSNPADLTHADMRRASALIVHYGRGDEEGLTAVFKETSEAHREVSLILAILAAINEIMPAIYTDFGMSIMSAHIMKIAGLDEEQQQ